MSKIRNLLRIINKVLVVMRRIAIPMFIISIILMMIINKDLNNNIFTIISGISFTIIWLSLPISIVIYIIVWNINCKYFNNVGDISDVPPIFIKVLHFARTRKTKLQFVKDNKPTDSYFRDIPCNKDVLKAYWICYYADIIKDKTRIIGTLLLKWYFEDRISFESNDTQIVFKEPKKFDKEYEWQLFYLLKTINNNDNMLNIDEFKIWCKSYGDKIFEYLESILADEEEELVRNDLIKYLSRKKFTREQLMKMKYNKFILSEELNNDYNNILGFKRYIENFGLMEIKQLKEVQIWENYLVFAYLLGRADTSDEKLNKFISKYKDIEKILNSLYL